MNIFNNRQGFTIIEVMVGIAVFSIGFLAVATLQTESLQRTTRTSAQTEAWELASNQTERLFSLDFYPEFLTSGAADRFVTDPDLVAGSHERTIHFTNRVYRIEWDVTDMAGPGGSYLFPGDRNLYTDDDVPRFKSIEVRVIDRESGRELAQMQFVKVFDYEI